MGHGLPNFEVALIQCVAIWVELGDMKGDGGVDSILKPDFPSLITYGPPISPPPPAPPQ